jgi:methionyl-tRNA formyltransferase
MERLVIFVDSSSFISNILVDSVFSKIKTNSELNLILVVDTNKKAPSHLNIYKFFAIELIKLIFNLYEYKPPFNYVKILSKNIYHICNKNNIKIVKPNDINDPEFLVFLKQLKPSLGLAIGCPQIMKPPLINLFDIIVNYHNSLLPKYRGLFATSWSIYMGEKVTGFTYHIVNEKIDDGNIILQDSIEIENKTQFELEIEKTLLAGEYMEELLGLMIDRYKGMPQQGEKSYYGLKDFRRITFIENISNYEYEEIERRIRCFGFVLFKEYDIPITKIVKVSKSNFITKDGVAIKPVRFIYMPNIFAKIYKMLKGVRSKKYE